MATVIIKKDDIELEANSRATEVVVYSDKAEVKRMQKANLKRGETRIVFSNLGAGIDGQSIKSTCAAGNVKILSTTLAVNNLYFFRQKEDENVYNRICSCLKDIIALTDEKIIYALENHTTTDLREYIKSLLNDIILTQENSIPKLNAALDFLEHTFRENTLLIIETNEKLKHLHEQRALLEERLAKIRALDKKVQYNIEVSVHAEEACSAEVEVSYILPGVSWKTSYDAKLINPDNEIELSCFGEIRQQTGEVWKDVRVILSTAAADVQMEIPKIYPVYMSGYEEKRRKALVVETEAFRDLEEESGGDEVEETPSDEGGGESRVEVSKRGISYTFVVKNPCDIPSDDRWHRFLIITSKSEPEFSYETVPELMEYVYLKATLTNDTGLPMLPGKIAVYRNESYMGSARMKYVAPEEVFHLSFGIDEDVKVRRIRHKATEREAKGLSLKHVMEWEYHFILYNYKKETQKVRLKEGVYVSELKEVNIRILDDTSPGYTMNREGIVCWDTELSPDPFQHKKLVLHYTLTAPKSFQLGDI
ncbi:MAG: mucoidy inhibitor MuiA family protein [Spirochaetales bacterium]|nr:mucoidy inhibitor MuiA family protein [Spirochaetales bacterium]